jgi:hypothetical protein
MRGSPLQKLVFLSLLFLPKVHIILDTLHIPQRRVTCVYFPTVHRIFVYPSRGMVFFSCVSFCFMPCVVLICTSLLTPQYTVSFCLLLCPKLQKYCIIRYPVPCNSVVYSCSVLFMCLLLHHEKWRQPDKSMVLHYICIYRAKKLLVVTTNAQKTKIYPMFFVVNKNATYIK